MGYDGRDGAPPFGRGARGGAATERHCGGMPASQPPTRRGCRGRGHQQSLQDEDLVESIGEAESASENDEISLGWDIRCRLDGIRMYWVVYTMGFYRWYWMQTR